MKIVSTIEARMTSTRLPGKVLMKAGGKPMLEHLIDRLKCVPSIEEIVVATTINPEDEPIVSLAKGLGVECHRGSEDDVLGRVVEAAESVEADIVVEIMGDCPLIDPEVIEYAIDVFMHNDVDYLSNASVRSIRTYPNGMDTRVFHLDTLRKSASMTNTPLDREHVTLHIIDNPDIFSRIDLPAPRSHRWPELEITLDESADYELIKRIIEHFTPKKSIPSLGDIIKLLRENEEWLKINEGVPRKGAT